MTAWIVRAGESGQRDDWALTKHVAGGGFHEVPDLTAADTREKVGELVAPEFAGDPPMRIANYTGQLWALRGRIQVGDLIVLPLKTTKKIALGVCDGGYRYLDSENQSERHAISVDWRRTDVSRAALKDDLLNTINGAMTIFEASKNNADARLHAILDTAVDPGAGATSATTTTSSDGDDAADVVDPTPAITMESVRDRVRTHLVENFGQHKLTHLVADILRTDGYVCDVSPKGPDFGVDIMAGRGLLGLDPPTLVVQVKSEASQ